MLVAAVSVSAAAASTITYSLLDHPGGAKAVNPPFADYGIRADSLAGGPDSDFFSFERNSASAKLVYDMAANTATISGTVWRGLDPLNHLWALNFVVTNTLPVVGPPDGQFTSMTIGTGSLVKGAETIFLRGKARGNGDTFLLTDQNPKSTGDLLGALYGEGWIETCIVGANSTCAFNGGTGWTHAGTNDFLFRATVVPLPAAGWMLIAGLGGLVAMKRRKS